MKSFVFTVVVPAVFLWSASARPDTPNVIDWPTPAKLRYAFTAAGTSTGHPIFEAGITWDQHIVQAKVLPTPRVRFGPFHVSATFTANPAHLKAAFEIAVWARSPALYRDGRFAGADAQMRMIGRTSASFTDDADRDLYVTATLPSIFSALQIRAQVHDKTSVFPGNCGDLPPEGGLPDLDGPCMKAAVNPLAASVPHVAPLAIIYEPPGNCSLATLTETHVVGSQMRAQDSNSTSTHSLTDPGPLASAFGAEKHDYTDTKISERTRTSSVTVRQSSTFGTLLSSGPDPRCTDPQAAGPSREHRGPGQGDVFLFLVNPPIFYWDTGTLSNFLFAPDSVKPPRGHEKQLAWAFAWWFAAPPDPQGNITVADLQFSPDEAKAILALDPFTKSVPPLDSSGAGPFSYPELPKRFVPMSVILTAVPRAPGEQVITRDSVVEADAQACTESGSANVDNDDPDFMTKLTVKALQYDLAGLVGTAGGGNRSINDLAKGIGDAIKGLSLSDILPHAETKLTLTYASCKNLRQTAGEETTQRFALMDTDHNLHVLQYYDSFFGTVAFVPLPAAGMGGIRDARLLALRLPHFIWKASVRNNQNVELRMPQAVSAKLAALGYSRLEPVPSGDIAVPKGYTKGVLPSLTLSQDGSKVSGHVPATQSGAAQTAYVAKTSQGKPVALLWITTTVDH